MAWGMSILLATQTTDPLPSLGADSAGLVFLDLAVGDAADVFEWVNFGSFSGEEGRIPRKQV